MTSLHGEQSGQSFGQQTNHIRNDTKFIHSVFECGINESQINEKKLDNVENADHCDSTIEKFYCSLLAIPKRVLSLFY